MSVFSKILESLGKTISKELDKSASKNASKEATKQASKNLAKPSNNPHKQIHKEQRGIYNVTYNGKNATAIHKDLEKIDEVIAYSRGTKRKGAAHIRLEHSTDSTQQGYVTPDEVANLGQNIRSYIKTHGQPFSDTNKARVYEWEKEGVRFRAVVNDMPKKEASGCNSNLPAASKNASSGNSNLPSASEEIITFYSDRNLKNKMNFKNPALNQSKKQESTQNLPFTRE